MTGYPGVSSGNRATAGAALHRRLALPQAVGTRHITLVLHPIAPVGAWEQS